MQSANENTETQPLIASEESTTKIPVYTEAVLY